MNQIEVLRKAYGSIEKIDPCTVEYKNLITLLDSLSTKKLMILADAQIKWVSMLARNRVSSRTKVFRTDSARP